MTRSATNPFRIGEHVRGAWFTDRAAEVATVTNAMRHRGRLLVQGARRMGKSTVIGVAAERLRHDGAIVLDTDLAAITTVAEAADRLLAAVSRQAAWQDRLLTWVQSLAPTVVLSADATGQPRLSLGVEARRPRAEGEREAIARVLDRIDEMASSHAQPVVVVLDEFQRLSELGGEAAEWLLRNRMQEHRHTAYVCAGSKEGLIREMLQRGRAFYGFFEQLHVGPIDPAHLASWIEDRMRGSGVKPAPGVGARIVEEAGPRTQDILHAARMLWFRTVPSGAASHEDVSAAIEDIVAGDEASLRRTWDDLTAVQQRLLRAVAAGAEQIHSTDTREQFRLGASSSVAAALDALVARGVLEREPVRFENPFFRVWIERQVLTF